MIGSIAQKYKIKHEDSYSDEVDEDEEDDDEEEDDN